MFILVSSGSEGSMEISSSELGYTVNIYILIARKLRSLDSFLSKSECNICFYQFNR